MAIAIKIYTIIAGVNGAGKSSFTGVLKAERGDLGHIVDVDKLAAEECLGAIKAGKAAVIRINAYLSKGVSFTQETTLSGQKTGRTVRLAKEKGYLIRLFYIGINTSGECVKRVKNRVSKGGHDVAESVVERRFQNRFESLRRILPYCDQAFLFDNENGFAEVAVYKNGELTPKGDYRPDWLRELIHTTPRGAT